MATLNNTKDTLFDLETDLHEDIELSTFIPDSNQVESKPYKENQPSDSTFNITTNEEVNGEASLLNALMNMFN